MQCAVVRNGIVENVIVAEPHERVPGRELIGLAQGSQVESGWLWIDGKFKPGPDSVTSYRTEIISPTEVRMFFDYAGARMPVHAHDDAHSFRVEAGSFLLRVGDTERVLTATDGEQVLPPNVSHEFIAREDNSVAVNIFTVPR